MDQSSTNDTEKRNWRERLGIGGKELPRISEGFTRAPEIELTSAAPTRNAQPVAKPAPMAPRLPMKSGSAADFRPQQQIPAPGGLPQAPDALAEKLRSQRAAAEKLAEQRVMAAKQRAENSNGAPVGFALPKAAVATVVEKKPPPAPSEKPKFTFADDETKAEMGRGGLAVPQSRLPQRPPLQQPQLSPPRPPLGGQLRPPAGAAAATGFQPQYRPQPPRGYSPSAYMPSAMPQPQRGVNAPLSKPPTGDPRLQPPRLNPDAYRRSPQDDLGYAGNGPMHRSSQRSIAPRGPAQAFDDDFGDEIFEEAAPSRSSRRASANDYNQAYRENDGGYADQRRRSSGPWLLLLLLMLAAGAAGAGVWYYQINVKSVANNTSTGSAPLVAAPEQSAKSAPEQPLEGQSNPPSAASSKKQIYDRIIGDNEVLGGKLAPAEETPIQPESQQGNAEIVPEPAGSSNSLSESGEALPLPMPPPSTGSDTQGALTSPAGSKTVALTTPSATKSTGLAVESEIAPVPGETAAAATTEQATPPAAQEPAKEEIVNLEPEPVPFQKKPTAKKSAAEESESLGAAPVVLVPPSETIDTGQDASAPLVASQPAATAPAPVVKKKKTLFDLLRGTNDQSSAAQTVTTAPVPQQQVAAIDPAPDQQQSATSQVTSAGNGYFVQLASFKSEAEAKSEFVRLRSKHAGILGTLPSAINPATVGGSTRFRLAVGPLSSRDQATKICGSLVAAGERDCLVRKQ